MYGYSSYGIFEKLGIPVIKPWMYVGSIGRINSVYYVEDTLNAKTFGRIWGIYELKKPMLAVMDPNMLKTILVKECFTYFTNRRNFVLNGEIYDTVSLSENDEWRRLRNLLSPSFTSGHLKEIFGTMKHHASRLTASLRPKALNDEVITLKDFFGAYGLDVLASYTLGVDLDIINKPSSPFVTHASKLFRIPVPLYMLQGCFPFILPLLELMGFSLFSKSSSGFFKKIVEKIRADPSMNSQKTPNNLLQSLINGQSEDKPKKDKENKAGMTDHQIISQIAVFITAGYETTATALTFLAYTLARYPEVMKRLQEEIDATFPEKGSVQYEALMQMEYLDCVVSECMRLYPSLPRLERVAKETVMVNGITVPKGMMVVVPVYALHRDPEFWPEPEEFRPDRFSKENKENIQSYTYLPFGAGPRNCIGMRFALLMIKMALVEVLQNYSFSVCAETQIPVVMSPEGLLGPLTPIKLKVVTRSNQ